MNYSIRASSSSKKNASMSIKQSEIIFGITPDSSDVLANPAELFLRAFSACILKNVERFSVLMKFEYSSTDITVKAVRKESPPRMDEISYELLVYSQDNTLNVGLLKKNIEKFGTIFNTVKSACSVSGEISRIPD